MEIKVGMFYRTNLFGITEIGCINNEDDIKTLEIITDGESSIKVADTPQELILKDDLVFDKLDNQPKIVGNNYNEMPSWEKAFVMKEVIKILTPQGKDYICQWEAES